MTENVKKVEVKETVEKEQKTNLEKTFVLINGFWMEMKDFRKALENGNYHDLFE